MKAKLQLPLEGGRVHVGGGGCGQRLSAAGMGLLSAQAHQPILCVDGGFSSSTRCYW